MTWTAPRHPWLLGTGMIRSSDIDPSRSLPRFPAASWLPKASSPTWPLMRCVQSFRYSAKGSSGCRPGRPATRPSRRITPASRMPWRRITARDARLCTSVRETTGRCEKGRSPLERRPADLGRVATAGQGVADGPAQLEHRLAVEVEPGEAAAADERPVRPVVCEPFADAVSGPSLSHVRGPRLGGRPAPGSGPQGDNRIAVQPGMQRHPRRGADQHAGDRSRCGRPAMRERTVRTGRAYRRWWTAA